MATKPKPKDMTPEEIRQLIADSVKAALTEVDAAPPGSTKPFWQSGTFWSAAIMMGVGLLIKFGGITTEMTFDDMAAYGAMLAGIVSLVIRFLSPNATQQPLSLK